MEQDLLRFLERHAHDYWLSINRDCLPEDDWIDEYIALRRKHGWDPKRTKAADGKFRHSGANSHRNIPEDDLAALFRVHSCRTCGAAIRGRKSRLYCSDGCKRPRQGGPRCDFCGEEMERKRSTKKFCSETCRVKGNRP